MLDVATHSVADFGQRDHPCGSRHGHGPSWAVAQTHPQAERWALANLTRQGFTTYLPMIRVRRRDRHTPTIHHPVDAPLFTGYLFVIPGTHWAPIAHTRGIARLLMANGRPSIVPNHILAALQATEDARRSLPPPGAQWAPGTPCSLATGPFAGLSAVVTHTNGDCATIACLFLGQLREITVPTDSLMARE